MIKTKDENDRCRRCYKKRLKGTKFLKIEKGEHPLFELYSNPNNRFKDKIYVCHSCWKELMKIA